MDTAKAWLERGWSRLKEIPWNPATIVLAVLALGVLGLALELLAGIVKLTFYAAVAGGIAFVVWKAVSGKMAKTDPEDEADGPAAAWWEVFGS